MSTDLFPRPISGRFGFGTIIDHGGRLEPVVVADQGVVTLAGLIGGVVPPSVRGLLDDWDGWCDRVATALMTPDLPWVAPGEVVFAPPVPDPPNLYLAGANYRDHVAEMGRYAADMKGAGTNDAGGEVFHFMIPSTSLVGTGHDIVRPPGADQLDWEVELAVVIGRRAERVPVEEALDFVAGYTVANDVSLRGPATMHPIFGVRFLVAKGQATLTPMGPAITPARFVPDPGVLAISTDINGVKRQNSNTEQMICSVAEQIALLSRRAPLLPGDIILTGTPAGTAAAHNRFLVDGDEITMTVEGLGTLVNTVVPAAT